MLGCNFYRFTITDVNWKDCFNKYFTSYITVFLRHSDYFVCFEKQMQVYIIILYYIK